MASETSIIKIFAKFIDKKVAKKLKTIDEILDLPISTYKFVDEELSKDLEENFKDYSKKDKNKKGKLFWKKQRKSQF